MKQRSLVVVSAGLSLPSSTRLLADRLSAAAVDRRRPTSASTSTSGCSNCATSPTT